MSNHIVLYGSPHPRVGHRRSRGNVPFCDEPVHRMKHCMSFLSIRMPPLKRQRKNTLKFWRRRNFNAKPATNLSLAKRLWLFTWEGIPAKNLSSVITVPKPLPSQQTRWHIWELTQERNHMLALCVENASLSPPLLLRTCALTLARGLFSVPSVEGHLPKGEVNSTNFLSTLAFG